MKRIQKKNLFDYSWKSDPKAVYIGRPSRWGNPYKLKEYTLPESLELYRSYLDWHLELDPNWLEPLRGKNLVCYCSLDQPCHGDIIIEYLGEVSENE